jgi:RNA polymerase sigma-B factor
VAVKYPMTTAIVPQNMRRQSVPLAEPDTETTDYTEVGPLFQLLADAGDDELARKRLRRQIITISLPLAAHIARRFGNRGESFDDLVQVARVGLVNAVDRYDVTRGGEFLSFAVPTIMGEVRRYFRDNTWAMHVPRSVKENHLRLRATVDALAHTLGRSPTVREISNELGIDAEDVTQALVAGNAYQPTSIDSAMTSHHGGDRALLDTYGEDESGYEHIDQYLTVKPLLAHLPERERAILTMRFFESMTQTQIAQKMGLSQMHVSRILARTLAQLREQATL